MQSNARVGGRNKRGKRSSRKGDRGRVVAGVTSLSTLSAGVGFPRKLHARHRYVEALSLTITAGALQTYIWSCNGMYDPNITGSGHQPMYFDELGAIYDHYTVFKSSIRVELLGGTAVPYRWSCAIDDDTSVSSTSQTTSEQTGAKGGLLSGLAVRPQIVNLSWDAKAFFGGDIYDNDNLSGTTAANPTEQSYFVVQATTADASTGSIYIRVTIEYDAVWDELKTNTGS